MTLRQLRAMASGAAERERRDGARLYAFLAKTLGAKATIEELHRAFTGEKKAETKTATEGKPLTAERWRELREKARRAREERERRKAMEDAGP